MLLCLMICPEWESLAEQKKIRSGEKREWERNRWNLFPKRYVGTWLSWVNEDVSD